MSRIMILIYLLLNGIIPGINKGVSSVKDDSYMLPILRLIFEPVPTFSCLLFIKEEGMRINF